MKTYSLILLFVITIFINIIIIVISEISKSKKFNDNHLYSYKKLFGFTKQFIYSGKNIIIDENEKNNLTKYFENMSNKSLFNFNNVKSNKLYHFQLKKIVPKIINHIESDDFQLYISSLVGTKLYLSEDDNDRIFARSYINSNDNIKWHYDNNFSDGKRYTVIIPIYINEKNSSSLQYVNPSHKQVLNVIDDQENLYLYEGDKIYHRVTEQVEGGKRIVLIIPMYEKRFTWFGELKMSFKNSVFRIFGL